MTKHIFNEADRINRIRELEAELEIPPADLDDYDTQEYLDWLRDTLYPRGGDEGPAL
jgi:hypothetical protein